MSWQNKSAHAWEKRKKSTRAWAIALLMAAASTWMTWVECRAAVSPVESVVVFMLASIMTVAGGVFLVRALMQVRRLYRPLDYVQCRLCRKPCRAATAHIHGSDWVGDECCWDERLRTAE